MRGLHLRKPGNTLSQTEPMSTKLDDAFATLRILIADTSRDLALAMAELRSVAAERDALSEALQRNCVQYVEKQQELIAERDNILETMQRNSVEYIAHHQGHRAELDTARQSLRAAEADLAETEGINSDLRGVNKRLVADLAAATQRAENAESAINHFLGAE